jgi:3-oxoacyl-[acyl-carrier protein] reductase
VHPKVVLVTGASGAIGSAIVRALCEEKGASFSSKYFVVAHYHRNEARARVLQEATNCDLKCADVGDERAVEAMFANLPPLFAVIHAAAISRDGLLLRTSPAVWRQTLRVDLDGTFLVTRAALNSLEDEGRLILVASRVGESGAAGQGTYAAAKGGVLGLMRAAAHEAAARHITVNALCPGWIASSMTNGSSEAAAARRQARSVFGRGGDVAAVVSATQWLLSEAARDVSGQVIHCDSRMPVDRAMGAPLLPMDTEV